MRGPGRPPRSSAGPGPSGAWIKLLLRFFPADFREEYGDDLLAAFLDLKEDRERGVPRVVAPVVAFAATLRTSGQIVRSGLAERRSRRRRMRRTPRSRRKEAMLPTLVADVRYALRGHAKHPGFAIVTVLILALGVGASTAIFSVVHGVLLRPLPYPDSDQLVSVQVNSGIGSSEGFYDLSEPEFLDLGTEITSFSGVAGFSGREVTMGDSVEVRRIRVLRATANLFPLLGVEPLLGRTFSADEDLPDVPRVVVLSYGMWQTDFGGVPDILGRSVTIEDQPVTIIGVMPPDFGFPEPGWDAYSQLQLDRTNPWARNNHYLPTVARLAHGATMEQARAEVGLLARRSTETYPEYYPNTGYRVRLESLQDAIVGTVKTPLYVLLAAVGFVLLTACVNVANLLLARGETRKRELAIRAALGAAGVRLTRQLFTESLLLAALGGAAGLAVAAVGVKALVAMAPDVVPRLGEIGIDGTVLGFSLLTAVATGLLFGVMPALQPTRQDVNAALKEGGGERGASGSGAALRRALVGSQVMLAVVLVTGSGLMLRSLVKIYRVDMGFATENILSFRLNPSPSRYDTPEKRVAFYSELLQGVTGLPGVSAAGATYSLPMAGGSNNWSILIEGQPVANVGEAPANLVQRVTPGYFDALGLTLIRGRLFTRRDDARSPPVVVISEAMAREHWPGEDPIGKRMKVFSPNWPWMEVIGVVKDVRHGGPTQEPRPRWYVPYAQAYATAYESPLANTIVVRSEGDPTPLMGLIEDVLDQLDSNVPVSSVRTMDQILDGTVGGQRFVMTLLSVFGLLALFLAVVGVYGVVSYTVSRRTHEIGLRVALGARGGDVLTSVLGEGILLSAAGVAAGLGGSILLSRVFASMVFGIPPTDPLTYGGVGIALMVATALASLLPAWRASRVSPMVALRDR